MRCLHTYLWPAASTSSGGAWRTLFCVRSSVVSVSVEGTMRPADSKAVTMTVIFARSSVDLDTITALPAHRKPQTDLPTHASASAGSPPSSMSSSRCIKSIKLFVSLLNLASTVHILDAIPELCYVIHSVHRHPYAHELACFREAGQYGQHRLWYAKTCEHHPPPLDVDGAIVNLEIDQKHQQRDS